MSDEITQQTLLPGVKSVFRSIQDLKKNELFIPFLPKGS